MSGILCGHTPLATPDGPPDGTYSSNTIVPFSNNALQTIDILHKQWMVRFSVKLLGTLAHWSEFFRIGLGSGDNNVYGDRAPSVALLPKSQQMVITVMSPNHLGSTDSRAAYNPITPLNINQWTSLEVGQVLIDDEYLMEIRLDGEILHSVENVNPKAFENMIVYASTGYHAVSNVHIKDLSIMTFPDDGGECTDMDSVYYCKCNNDFITYTVGYVKTCKGTLRKLCMKFYRASLYKRFGLV